MANSLKARCECDLLTANSRLSNSFAKQTKNNDPSEGGKKTRSIRRILLLKPPCLLFCVQDILFFLVMKLGLIPSSQRVVWDKNRAGVWFHYLCFSLDQDILLSRLSDRRSKGVVGRSSLHYHEHVVPWHETPRQGCDTHQPADKCRRLLRMLNVNTCWLGSYPFICTNATVTNTCPSAMWYPPLR